MNQDTNPAAQTPWLAAEQLADLPAIDEALRNFSDDATADNATGIITAVLEALRAKSTATPVVFMGLNPLAIVQNPTLPMIPDSWRYSFYQSGSELRFGAQGNGDLVAWEAVKDHVAAQATMAKVHDMLGTGALARSEGVLLTSMSNLIRRENILSAIEREFFMVPGEPDADFPGEEPDDECLLNWGENVEQYVERFRAALVQRAHLDGGLLPVGTLAWALIAKNGNVIIWSKNRSTVEGYCARYPEATLMPIIGAASVVNSHAAVPVPPEQPTEGDGQKQEWSYSTDEEYYREQEPSRIAIIRHALAEIEAGDDGATGFWIGKNVRFIGQIDAGSIIEQLQEQAYEECGEFAETYLEDVTKDEEAELEGLVNAWAVRVDRSNFWTVKNTEFITIGQAREIASTAQPGDAGAA